MSRNRLAFYIVIFIVSIFISCDGGKPTLEVVQDKNIERPKIDVQKTIKKGGDALNFVKKNKMNADFCLLADMSLHSGVKRLIFYDLKNQKIITSFLVGHGCGNGAWSFDQSKENPEFSNVDGSHKSSLGKYKLGNRGYSDWGIHVKYMMHGLEESNSNALKRFIVFHSWEKMSDDEVYPKGSPEGWGCPTVSNKTLVELDPILKKSTKPILFWMYK